MKALLDVFSLIGDLFWATVCLCGVALIALPICLIFILIFRLVCLIACPFCCH